MTRMRTRWGQKHYGTRVRARHLETTGLDALNADHDTGRVRHDPD